MKIKQKIIIWNLILLTLFAIVFAKDCSESTDQHKPNKNVKCKDPNEIFTKDDSKYNKKTCDNWWIEENCLDCTPGCYCKEGFVRNAKGKCVERSKCPTPKCEDECKVFEECGTACPKTCENYDQQISCIDLCVPGCFCRDDLVLDAHGNCIESSKCPPRCEDANREWSDCGSACPLSCDNPTGSIPCTQQCVQGCFCKDGLVEDKDGNCILPELCPAKECQDPNRVYLECGSACPLSCENLNDEIVCTKQCVAGCFCKEGLIEDDHGNCIEPNRCPPKHTCDDPKREWNDCGTACPVTCDNFGQPIFCTRQCVQGCFCIEGLIEDPHGNCVEPEDCPDTECKDPNTHFDACGSACPDTCDNYKDTDRDTLQCVRGCFCNEGLVLDADGNCIKPENCPKDLPSHC